MADGEGWVWKLIVLGLPADRLLVLVGGCPNDPLLIGGAGFTSGWDGLENKPVEG
jgi:hypothetical protein